MSTPEISSELQANLYGDAENIPVKLSFKADDPYIVEAEFTSSKPVVSWKIGRSLLKEAVDAQPGQLIGDPNAGDIGFMKYSDDFSHDQEYVVMELNSPDGQATVLFDSSELKTFVEKSYGVVSEAQEQLAIDAGLEILNEWVNQQ